MERIFKPTILWVLLVGVLFESSTANAFDNINPHPEVVVYGGTPAGIAAAIAAGQSGHQVLLVEPYSWVGGMVTNGLSHTDFRTFEGLTGTFLKFTKRVKAHYAQKHGPDSPQARGCFRGTHGEPHVNLQVFREMLAEHKTIQVRKQFRLIGVSRQKNRIVSAVFESDGTKGTIHAKFWIDATYEGDLMAMAKVPFQVRRESREQYGESLAPEKADKQVQGYNFRLIMTPDPNRRVKPAAPPGYRREEFLPLLELYKTGKLKTVFCYPRGGIYKAQKPTLPNKVYDINDVSHGAVRLSLPQINDAWPDGTPETRKKIFAEHLRHNLGILYFLQNDKAVPDKIRRQALPWGLCKIEFPTNNHLPEQLYVREARRMVGMKTFTQQNTVYAKRDARSIFQPDSIGIGDYGPNCHGTAHEGPRFGGRHVGEFYKSVAPYQIPYGVLIPKNCDNLLVPVACSSSHVGFCAIRLEPIWTGLGQASGFAASVALKEKVAAAKVSVPKVQKLLHTNGAATIYVSDVLPDSPDFATVQWWGSKGGLHGLAPTPKRLGQRGKHIVGQYFKAYPGQAVELKKPLDQKLKKRWLALAQRLGLPKSAFGKNIRTRGEFISFAANLYHHKQGK